MNLSPAAIVAAICCLICSGVFFSVGVFVKKSNAPIHFWSGALVLKKKITDARSYNMANAMIWFGFGLFMVVCAVLAILFSITASIIGVVALCALAFPVLKLLSKHFYFKFSSVDSDNTKAESSGE